LRKAAARIERGKADSVLLDAKMNEILALNQVIKLDSSYITDLNERMSVTGRLSSNQQGQIKILEDELKNCNDTFKKYVKKTRFTKGVAQLAAIITAGLGVYLITK